MPEHSNRYIYYNKIIARKIYKDLRRLTERILCTSQYFATILRATTIPYPASIFAILLQRGGS